MARKTHVIGYRLGERVWWKERTPPQIGVGGDRGIEKLVRGVMERYGYITSEVMVQKGRGKGGISLIGGKGRRMEMYIMEYLGEIIKKKENGEYKISYREERKTERNGELKYREIAKSTRSIRVAMKRRKWKWK